MKTHSLAKELIALGEALLQGPNIDTKKLNLSDGSRGPGSSDTEAEMAFGITTLAQLSKFSRSEWVRFADEHSLPIQFNERDSGRNIMGKIMSYLAGNEHEIKRVQANVSQSSNSSNRLNQALNTLLKSSLS
ncbi:hypothetical protein [Ruegeria sp. Alg231-54]|uniref:hypothetical protein n=1 Tax=Ruegeria sp. Alg231-54 TaxID=1922221 RepID=UPI000D551361|nr:hypothetical protein [Ruegeria sp. Alg231-54]